MRERCEVIAYVRSRKVVVWAREIRGVRPLSTALSPPVQLPVRATELRFGRRLGSEQSSVVAEARRLAAATGNPLRIVDLGRTNVVLRSIRLWLLGGRVLPVVVMRGSCPWHLLEAVSAPPLARNAKA